MTLSIENNIGDAGATSLSEALKSNTTLTQLNLWGEDKKRRHKRHPSTIHFSILITSTDNQIEETGTTSLSESLKSNTTLSKLNLGGEDKGHTKDIHHQLTLFHYHHANS